ncbi:MAG: hypothetical protein WBD36_03510 [Bacteroidota bacterium]
MGKKREPEYTLNVFRQYDERTKTTPVVFLVQTTKIFVSFRYEILLEDEVHETEIHLRIVGLHAPTLLMPGMGPAQGYRKYEKLRGIYLLRVTKQDKSVNEFEIEITPKSISVKKEPAAPFVMISTESVPFE